MIDHRLRIAASLASMLLLLGCASRTQRTALELGNRMETRLSPAIKGGQAVLERLPDGARVTLSEQSLFPNGSAELDNRGRYVLASVVEGLMDPRLLRIDVSEPASTPLRLRQARLQAVIRYLHDVQVAPQLLLAALQQGAPPEAGGATSQALAITVTIVPRPEG